MYTHVSQTTAQAHELLAVVVACYNECRCDCDYLVDTESHPHIIVCSLACITCLWRDAIHTVTAACMPSVCMPCIFAVSVLTLSYIVL